MPRKNKPTYTIYEVDLFGIGHGHLKLKEPAPLEYKLAIPEPNSDCMFLNEVSPMEIFPSQPRLVFILKRNCMETTYRVAHIEFNNTQIDVSDITPKQWFRDHQFIPNREGWMHRGTHLPESQEEEDAPEGIINHTEDHFNEIIALQRSRQDRMADILRTYMEQDPLNHLPSISPDTSADTSADTSPDTSTDTSTLINIRTIHTELDFINECHQFTNRSVSDRLIDWYIDHTTGQGVEITIEDALHNHPIMVSTTRDLVKYEILNSSGVRLNNVPSFTIQTCDYISADDTGAPISITNDRNAYWEAPSAGRIGYSTTGGDPTYTSVEDRI